MKKYKELTSTSPSHSFRKTKVRWYSKEYKDQVIKTIASLRQIGLTWEEIKDELKSMYGLGEDISVFRKEYNALERNGNVLAEVDSIKSIDLLAKAKNKILIERKVNCKQRNLLNYETQVIAFRKQITDILSDFKWKPYQNIGKVSKAFQNQNKPLNKAIYIIADEHFKGKCDILHLNSIYDRIEEDIKINHLQNVELWYLGDSIDGLIHTGSLASNDGTITPAIDYINILIERVNKISQVKEIKFIAQSNHTQTRPLGTSRNELAREDINYMLIEIMKRGLRKDIKLIANDIIKFNYNNLDIVLSHGHRSYEKSKVKMIEYWSSKYKIVPDIIIIGHYHQFKITEYGKNKWLVVCPTAKNFNGDYEEQNGFISYSQIVKLTFNKEIPNFQIIGV